jgi:TonB family protein
MRHLISEKHRLFSAGLILTGACFFGQPSTTTAQQVATTVPPATAANPPSVQQRLHKARALAAAHNLNAAVAELDAIRNSTTDNSVRDLARILLMSIYLEQSDQARTFQLLDEAFAAPGARNESTNRLYFALAGKVVTGTRERMERYREFGFSVADRDLPADAENDLNRLRASLEKVINQAKEIVDDNPNGTDALALLEDASMVRCSLARNEEDHIRWQNECATARQQLTDSETRIAAISSAPDPAKKKIELAKESQPTNGTWSQPVIDPDLAKDAIASNSAPVRSAPTVVRTAIIRSKNDPANVVNRGAVLEHATKKIAPSYPAVAKSARITGIVKVDVTVDEEGNVVEAKSTNGPEALRAAAIDAARRWKFQPMVIDGAKVRFAGFLTFNFTL